MGDCAFCEIVAGDREAHVLLDDDRTIAFLDGRPASRGHTLVVPKPHVTDLCLAEDAVASAVFDTIRTVGRSLDRVLDIDGFGVFHTTGDLVGSVEHAHVHLVPRRAGDDITLALERTDLSDHEPKALVDRVTEEVP